MVSSAASFYSLISYVCFDVLHQSQHPTAFLRMTGPRPILTRLLSLNLNLSLNPRLSLNLSLSTSQDITTQSPRTRQPPPSWTSLHTRGRSQQLSLSLRYLLLLLPRSQTSQLSISPCAPLRHFELRSRQLDEVRFAPRCSSLSWK